MHIRMNSAVATQAQGQYGLMNNDPRRSYRNMIVQWAPLAHGLIESTSDLTKLNGR